MYPQCRHVRPGGENCGAAAIKGSHWCWFHGRLHVRTLAQQARRRVHQRDASGRFASALHPVLDARPGQLAAPHSASADSALAADAPASSPASPSALASALDYGVIPVGAANLCHPDQGAGPAVHNAPLQLPAVEDSASIQLAIIEVLDALAANQIEAKRAGLLLYGLQVASSNARRLFIHSSSIRSVSYTGDGIPLAPQEYGWDVEDIEEECEREQAELDESS